MSQSKNGWQLNAVIALLGLIFVILCIQLFYWNTSSVKWEYSIHSVQDSKFEEEMRLIGAQGWEAVSARRASDGNRDTPVYSYEIIFKRPANQGVPASLFIK